MEQSENVIKQKVTSSIMRTSHYRSVSDITFEDDRRSLDQKNRIPFLTSSLIGCALEDTLIQLRCLEKCNNELKIIKTMADINYLKILKFGVKPMPVADDFVEMSKEELYSTIKKVEKLDSDRKRTNCVMENVYLDMALKGTFGSLKESNNAFVALEGYRFNLQIEESKNKIIRKDMLKQVRQQRNHTKTVLYDTQSTIEDLKTKLEDSVLLSETCCRYVDNWQVARTEQHEKTIENTEFCPITTINYYKQRSEHEHRVHTEVELLVNIVINETLEKVETWMAKYDRDMERIDLKIQIKKKEYHDMLNKRNDMEEQLKKREQMIKDWIKFKDDREKARLYHEKMTKAATAVQAWWRGLIVRLKLGPFKEKKKGKKGKK